MKPRYPQGFIASLYIGNLMMGELSSELSSIDECFANADDLILVREEGC